MSASGYYRFPTIHQDTIIFTCEDDLWTVPASGGTARRLTAGLAECSRPILSPDGSLVAFVGREEGHPEVFVMDASGGTAKRLTYLGAAGCIVVGWKDDEILFATNYGQPFLKLNTIYAVPSMGGEARNLGLGSAMWISFGEHGRVAIGRNTVDIARWKRYRGGTAGNIWLDATGDGQFAQFLPQHEGKAVKSNLVSPMCLGDRIYFISDHEGIGNIYSALADGSDLTRHTDHSDFYVRNATTDGQHIVYHAGGDIFTFHVITEKISKVNIEFHSPQTQRNRKFVDAAKYLDDYAVHPHGHSVAITTRGQSFTMPNWEEAVLPVGDAAFGQGVARYRLTTWLSDGKHLVSVSDSTGEEALEVHAANGSTPAAHLTKLNIGRVISLVVSPTHNHVVLSNHRQEVVFVDLDKQTSKVLDKSHHFPIQGLAFSPDGRYVGYGFNNTASTSIVKLANVESGETHAVTETVLRDVQPTFDPNGKYLYFLSYRVFNPVYDNLDFDMNFPQGMRPYCVSLRKDVPSPFVAVPKSGSELKKQHFKEMLSEEKSAKPEPKNIEIDFDGITQRIVQFPAPEAKYEQIAAAKGKVFFTSVPVRPMMGHEPDPPSPATLHCYDFEDLKLNVAATSVSDFKIGLDTETLIYRSDKRLRILETGEKPNGHNGKTTEKNDASRESGWLDLSRIKLSIEPVAEWRQMYAEAWRLQRDNFWTADMSGIDWQLIYNRYLPLVERAASRSEFSDLMWEMQGELGTSHCYEMGGDYRPEPKYLQGQLAADFIYDATHNAYKLTHIVRGDSWEDGKDSPLHTLGVNAKVGDLIVAVGGKRVSKDISPRQLLVNHASEAVSLTLADADGKNERTVTVKTIANETPLRYREWVETNRKKVHDATNGKVGYVHIPNMVGLGMSEFFRGYLAEVGRDALVVDVRFNGGGHTSQLILEKLNRKRLGYDLSRWGEPQSYPGNAVLGPIMAITNEFAGSDGDIFSHSFKMMKLGTLVGKRTWGGVIGIWPRHSLADGTVTTQPEFSFWFSDAGFGVENYGTDPNIDVDIKPQDYLAGRDTQLDAATTEIKKQMTANPPTLPKFPPHPNLALPKLPKREAAKS
jgi:tricorn protease